MKFKTLKGAALVAATSMLPLSQAAMAEVTISGWINEGVQFYDDGVGSDVVQTSENGTTLGSRITFAGSSEVATGIDAGFEVILEPMSNGTPLVFSNQQAGLLNGDAFGDSTGHNIGVLGSSVHVGGAWGKVTVGLQSMPTDNIAVLEDPSLTLWSGISPVFRGNGFNIQGLTAAGAAAGVQGILAAVANGHGVIKGTDAGGLAQGGGTTWGDFMSCMTSAELSGPGGIGIDCNGIYRQGVRYDLPAFGPVTIAIGYANDDIYDIAAKYKGDLGSLKAQLAIGYAVNNGVAHTLASVGGGRTALDAGALLGYNEAENFQLQAGLMHPATGLFGSIAYQHEESDGLGAGVALNGSDAISDDSDAWWLKVGIKKQWFSLGDTSLSFDYGQYQDQYYAINTGLMIAGSTLSITGSEVERIGLGVDQYFGSSLIIYGKWEQLSLDVDGTAAPLFSGADDLDTFTLGATYFF